MPTSASLYSRGWWWWWRWCVCTEHGFNFGFCRHLLAHVQVSVQGGDVLSDFAVVGYVSIAKRVAQL